LKNLSQVLNPKDLSTLLNL